MNFWDIALLILICGVLILAVRSAIRLRKSGRGCNGCCDGCPGCGDKRR